MRRLCDATHTEAIRACAKMVSLAWRLPPEMHVLDLACSSSLSPREDRRHAGRVETRALSLEAKHDPADGVVGRRKQSTRLQPRRLGLAAVSPAQV